MNFLPFALPEIGEEEINEVIDSLRSGWVTTGPKAKRLEQDFTSFLGLEGLESIAVNSATSGLHLALEALDVGPGDEVIVPTYTFTATAEIVRYLGATPIMVDVDPKTFNMTSKSFEDAITPKTKAVVPVHFAGLACDMDAIIAIAKKNNIKVVEDAAHALPTVYKGNLIGTLGSDVTVFSFYANKTMTTGEGGMVVTANPDIAKRCKVMRLHGISRDAFDRYTSTKPSWFYEIIAPGFKYNMPDIAASIGIHQLKKLPGFQIKRQQMAEYYNDALKDLPIDRLTVPMLGICTLYDCNLLLIFHVICSLKKCLNMALAVLCILSLYIYIHIGVILISCLLICILLHRAFMKQRFRCHFTLR
jgi:dTDP-4-amino-4,6-dideoxygalactose transaminase